MVTDKARQLRVQLQQLPRDDIEGQRIASEQLVEELAWRCNPTEVEFEELVTGSIMSAKILYRVLTGRYLYQWNRPSND